MKQRVAAFTLLAIGVVIGYTGHRCLNVSRANAQPPITAVQSPFAVPSANVVSDIFNPEEAINVKVYEQTNRGVVNISTKAVRAASLFREAAVEGTVVVQ